MVVKQGAREIYERGKRPPMKYLFVKTLGQQNKSKDEIKS